MFGKKKNESNEVSSNFPKLESGIRVEVLNFVNRLIFVGRLEVISRDVIEIREESGQKTPMVEYNTQVKVRGFQNGKPFAISGYVCGSSEAFWRLDRLQNLQNEEMRRFYRQALSLNATVLCVNQIFASQNEGRFGVSGPVSCRVMDISGGGVRVRCPKEATFQVDDWLFFSADSPLEDDPRMNYTCRVRRVVEGEDYNDYGCEFDGLTEAEQETLLRIVMAFQQKELRARRRKSMTE